MTENKCTCGTCSVCRANRKAEANADKPKKVNKPINRTPIKKKIVEKKPIDLEALKGKNVQLKGSKRVLSEEDIIAKQKEKERLKKEKDKAKRKAKREEITTAKIDQLQSKVIRLIYPSKCVTCGQKLEFKDLQCGHFLSRKYLVTRFNPENTSPQDMRCNIYGQGEQYLFSKFITEFHGEM